MIDYPRAGAAAFSPESDRIAYVDRETKDLIVLDFRGKDPFADGEIRRHVASTLSGMPDKGGSGIYWGRRSRQIYLHPAQATGELSQDIPGDVPDKSRRPQVVVEECGESVCVMEGSRRRVIARHGTNPRLVGDELVLYQVGGWTLRISIDGEGRTPVTMGGGTFKQPVTAWGYGCSPDGSLLMCQFGGNEELDVGLKLFTVLPPKKQREFDAESLGVDMPGDPAWSPDGKKLAISGFAGRGKSKVPVVAIFTVGGGSP